MKRIISALLVSALLGLTTAYFHDVATPAALASAPGDVDLSFDAGTISRQFAPVSINTVAVQPDGKILLGGGFDHVNGVERQGLARLNADGSLDTTFVPPLVSPGVVALALQPDGKILVGGGFGLGPIGIYRWIVRLNPDGSLDTSFNLQPSALQCGDVVSAIAVEPDGRIIIGGFLCAINNTNVNGLARLNSDGSLNTPLGAAAGLVTSNSGVKSVALQTDGKIVIGGEFAIAGPPVIRNLARLNANGTVDGTFNNTGTNLSSTVNAVAVQPDGKILAAGSFTDVGGVPRNRIARLNPDGLVEMGFAPNIAASQTILAMVLQTDGKILIGGVFGSPLIIGSRRNISRLNADGSFDSFYPAGPPGGTDNAVTAIARQADGKVLIGGDFSTVAGIARARLARLLDDPPPPTTVQFDQLSYSVAENGGNATIAVTRTGSTGGTATVDYATANGAAIDGQDYMSASGTLTFLVGETSKTFSVIVIDDTADEPDETVNLTLSNPTGGISLGTPFNAVLTILDDDAPVAADDSYSTFQNTPLTIGAPGVLGNDGHPNGPALTAVLVSGVASGALSLNADGSFNYTPNSGFAGTDTFTYRASDGSATSIPATVTIVVNPFSGVRYALIRSIIAGGGSSSSGGSYTLIGTIGQHDAAISNAGSYRVQGGFWPK